MRYLMCPPAAFNVNFLFNPWMTWREEVSPRRARAQWRGLRAAIEAAGGEVDTIQPDATAPAMTFTRDVGLTIGGRFLIFRNDGPRGDDEPRLVRSWLERHGVPNELVPFPLEGGNVLPLHDGRVLVGIAGGDHRAERYLAKLLERLGGRRGIGLPLAEVPYLHLDLVLADLAGRGWLLYPPGLGTPARDETPWRDLFEDRPVIEVSRDDAARLACNVVVVNDVVIGGWIPSPIRSAIEALGLAVVETPLDEFRKAGGGAHCLTLEFPGPMGGTP